MKKIAIVMFALVCTLLLSPQPVHAAAHKNVIMKSENEKTEIWVQLPDSTAEVTTLKLRVHFTGDIDPLDAENPLNFELDEMIQPAYADVRYHAEKSTYTIYLSDFVRVSDQTEFRLGAFSANTSSDASYTLTFTVETDGLAYVDGTGNLNEEEMAALISTTLEVIQSTTDNGNGNTSTGGTENGSQSNPGSTTETDGNQTEAPSQDVESSVETGIQNSNGSYAMILVTGIIGAGTVFTIRRQKLNK